MPDLTSLCRMKTAVEIPEDDTSRDEVLSQLIAAVSALVEEFCGRTFGSGTVTEFYSGDNTPVLVLRRRPVTAIIDVWEDGGGYWGQGADPFTSDSLLDATDYAVERDQPDGSSRCGLLYRRNGVWPRPSEVAAGNLSAWSPYGTGNVKVQYTAGYGAVPGAVELATQLAVSRVWKMMKAGGLVAGESTPGYSYSLATNTLRADGVLALPPEALSMLARYRELAVG